MINYIVIYTYIDIGSGSGPVRNSDPPSDITAACIVFADMKQHNIILTEASYTAMIRCYCINNQLNQALLLYHEMSTQKIHPKLRTFNPLLRHYALIKDDTICYNLYNDMIYTYNLIPTEREYQSMLILNILNNNSSKFQQVLTVMKDDIFVPSYSTWDLIKQYFNLPIHNNNSSNTDTHSSTHNMQHNNIQNSTYNNAPTDTNSKTDNNNMPNIQYNIHTSTVNNNGIVYINNEQLLSIDLNENNRSELLLQIEKFATSDNTAVSARSMLDSGGFAVGGGSADAIASDVIVSIDMLQSGGDASSSDDMVDPLFFNTCDAAADAVDCDDRDAKRVKVEHTNNSTNTTTITHTVDDVTTTTASATNTSSSSKRKQHKKSNNNKPTNTSSSSSRSSGSSKRALAFKQFQAWLSSQTTTTSSSSSSATDNATTPAYTTNTNTTKEVPAKPTPDTTALAKPSPPYRYDVILDGANIGYYKQNYAGAPAHIDYIQIHWTVLHLQHLGYHPLIILHTRHLDFKHLNLTVEVEKIVDFWRERGMLYVTPSGSNDDWYWLYGTVYMQCMIVSNDEMRDHHFMMLSPR